jgi:tripartite-type tricarboxylate transporter receptor subunit TctC
MKNCRKILGASAVFLAAALAGLLPSSPAKAQEPVRIVIGVPVGAGADAVARVVAEGLASELKTPVIVDARPGAGGSIAARYVKNAPADGRTLLLVNAHMMVTLPLTTKTPGYDPLLDFRLLGQIDTTALAVVVPAGTFATVKDWLSDARTNTASANFGIPAPGSAPEFFGFRLGTDAGVKLTSVPYRGNSPLVTDLLGRQVPAGITTVPDLISHHKAGKLKVLAVGSAERVRALPDVPTLKEAGFPGLDPTQWVGMAVPAGTPPDVLDRLRSALRTVLLRPKTAEQMAVSGNSVDYADHNAMARRLDADLKFWGQLIKDSGFVPQ